MAIPSSGYVPATPPNIPPVPLQSQPQSVIQQDKNQAAAKPKPSFQTINDALAAQGVSVTDANRSTVTCKSTLNEMEEYTNQQGKVCFKITVTRTIQVPGSTAVTLKETLMSSLEVPRPPDSKSMEICKQVLHAAAEAYTTRLEEGLKNTDSSKRETLAKEEAMSFSFKYDAEGNITEAAVHATGSADSSGVVKFTPLKEVVFSNVKITNLSSIQSSYHTKVQEKLKKARDLCIRIKTPPSNPHPATVLQAPQSRQGEMLTELQTHLKKDTLPPNTIHELLTLCEHEIATLVDDLNGAIIEFYPAKLREFHINFPDPILKKEEDLQELSTILNDFKDLPVPAMTPAEKDAHNVNRTHLEKFIKSIQNSFQGIQEWLKRDCKDPAPQLEELDTQSIHTGLKGYKPFRPGEMTVATTEAGAAAQAKPVTQPRQVERRQLEGFDIVPVDGDGNCMYNAISVCLKLTNGAKTQQKLRNDAAQSCANLMTRNSDHTDQMRLLLHRSILDYNSRASTITKIPLKDDPQSEENVSAYEAYIKLIKTDGFWGGDAELYALGVRYGANVSKVTSSQGTGKPTVRSIVTQPQLGLNPPHLYLDYTDGNHYNALFPKNIPKNIP